MMHSKTLKRDAGLAVFSLSSLADFPAPLSLMVSIELKNYKVQQMKPRTRYYINSIYAPW
jgi:hypothetical protein